VGKDEMAGTDHMRSGGIVRNLSLISGLVLFTFATTHFLNHAIGLLSLDTMDRVQEWRLAITRSWPGTIILAAALVTHITFGLLKLARRYTLRLPGWELTQLVLGLAIPFLLLPHIVNTRVARVAFGVQDSYLYELAKLWPGGALTQSALLLVVWAHGCLGIHHWLKFHSWYRMLQPLLLIVAVATPMAALAGFVTSGRALAALLADPAMAEQMRFITRWPNAFTDEKLAFYRTISQIAFAGLLGLVAGAVGLRSMGTFTAPKIAISYAGGTGIQTASGPTLLEISRSNGIAHASACGGRARCGTCCVRIDHGAATLAPPSMAERVTLLRIKAPDDARLACQIRPTAPLTVTRLVSPPETIMGAGSGAPDLFNADNAGVQRQVCLLHLQLRDIAGILQDRLPYDVFFILNEFFAAAGNVIDANSGRIERFFGDALLATFGQQNGLESGCIDAVKAARAIDLSLDRLNQKVAAELGRPVTVSIGIHACTMMMGRIGLGKESTASVIGLGSYLTEQLAGSAISLNWQMAISEETARRAGVLDQGQQQRLTLNVKNGEQVIDVIGIGRCRDIQIEDAIVPAY
jgi:adenylate cyclase